MRIGTDVVWGLEMARRRGSNISLGCMKAALEVSWHSSKAFLAAAEKDADRPASLELTSTWRGGVMRTEES
jgi:hypothetical protein